MIYIVSISVLSFILASLSNSIMDTVDHHFHISVFNRLKKGEWRKWWNGDKGWLNKYVDYYGDIKRGVKPRRVKMKLLWFEITKPVQICDAWHFFKMLMIVFQANSVSLPLSYFIKVEHGLNFGLAWLVLMFAFGVFWNETFNLFYDKVLRSDK